MMYFPDVSDYDMSTPSGMALYLAHCDLDPIRGLIEQTEKSLTETRGRYSLLACSANDQGDFQKQSMYSDLEGIFVSRIIPLSYESLLLIITARFQEALKTWCRLIKSRDDSLPELRDYVNSKKHGDLDKPIAYIQEYGHIEGIKADTLWESIIAIWTARNCIIHHGGYIEPNHRDKMRRFSIGINPDDSRLYLEYDDIKRIYETVVEFVDRVFSKAPKGE